jgi:hypothetical protein
MPRREIVRRRTRDVNAEPQPVVCPECGGVLGLAADGQRFYCINCGRWVEPGDHIVPDDNRPSIGQARACWTRRTWLKTGEHRGPCPGPQ